MEVHKFVQVEEYLYITLLDHNFKYGYNFMVNCETEEIKIRRYFNNGEGAVEHIWGDLTPAEKALIQEVLDRI